MLKGAQRAALTALGAVFAVVAGMSCSDVIDSSTSATTTTTAEGSSTSGASTETSPVLKCSEAIDEESCEMAADPDGHACAWLEVYSMWYSGDICDNEIVESRCSAVKPGGDCCALYHPQDDRYIFWPECFIIADDEGWESCCGDPPPSTLCSCLTST